MNAYGVLVIVVMNPPVISRAMPRPASISTSVAMIGWMPTHRHQESVPESEQQRDARRRRGSRPRRCRGCSGSASPAMIVSATAPEIAICAPTERSMPRVAITRRHAERDQHERRAVAQDVDERAVELAVAHGDAQEARARDRVEQRSARPAPRSARSAGSSAASSHAAPSLAISATMSSTSTVWRCCRVRRSCGDRASRRSAATGARTSSSSDEMKITPSPSLGELGDEALDLGLRPDVDAAGRFVEDQQLRRRSPASAPAAPSAGCRRTGCGSARCGLAGRMPSELHVLVDDLRRAARVPTRRSQPRFACTPSTMFSATVRSPMIPSAAAVLRRERDAVVDRMPGRRQPRGRLRAPGRIRGRRGRRRRSGARARCGPSRAGRRVRPPRRR